MNYPRIGDFVKVRNLASHPVDFMYASRSWVVPVAGEAMVPFEAVILSLGDPRSGPEVAHHKDPMTGESVWLPDRATEVRRLRNIYDNNTNAMRGNKLYADETKVFDAPNVEVYTLESDERILTVVDDPAGDSTTPITHTVTEDDALRSVISKQQSAIDELRAQLAILQEHGNGAYTSTPPEDPTRVTVAPSPKSNVFEAVNIDDDGTVTTAPAPPIFADLPEDK